jgi:hypothetical protein
MTIKKSPKGLAAAGRALWREVQGGYVLDPAEEQILLQMCRLTDTLARLETELASAETTVRGSRGQPVGHPLLAEIRLTSLALGRLTKQLALPQPKSASARRGRLPGVVDMTRKVGG